MACALCERDVAELTAHHLTPRQKTRRKGLKPSATVMICWACHRQLHSLFDHTQLEREINSVEKLREEPRMAKFLEWLRKQDPAKQVRVRSSKR